MNSMLHGPILIESLHYPEYALYVANLIHQDSRSVMKVVRYGLNIACFPDAHAVELVERQIVRGTAPLGGG